MVTRLYVLINASTVIHVSLLNYTFTCAILLTADVLVNIRLFFETIFSSYLIPTLNLTHILTAYFGETQI